jgi:hypothetical protein
MSIRRFDIARGLPGAIEYVVPAVARKTVTVPAPMT